MTLPVSIDRRPHPITTEGRTVRTVCVPPAGARLGDLVAATWPAPAPDLAVTLDGVRVPPAAWDSVLVRPGDVVGLTPAVALGGGGGGGGGTDPVRTALQVAVVAAALYVGGPAAAKTWGWSATTGKILSATVLVGGSLLVNAIAPPPLPDADLPGEGPAGRSQRAPVYTLTGGANRARPYEPLPLVLGSHRLYPDAAIQPWSAGAFYYAIYHCGLGDLDLPEAEWLVGDTAWTNVPWSPTRTSIGPVPTNVPGHVSVVAGGVLASRSPIVRNTPAGTVRVTCRFSGRIFDIDSTTGDYVSRSVAVRVTCRLTGQPSVTGTVTLTGADPDPVTGSLSLVLPAPGEWTVSVWRTTDRATGDREYDDVTWESVECVRPDSTTYTGQTRIGIKLVASAVLSGSMGRFAVLAHQKVPVWDGTRWSAAARSSNPAWIFRWFARGIYVGGELLAGAGLPAARIDDEAIQRWGAWCDAQGLRCDYVIQRPMSVAEVLTLIARCGRASYTWASGRLGVVYEDAATPPSALVTPGAIVAGSFEVEYLGAGADEVVVRYIDRDAGWAYESVRQRRTGVTSPRTSVRFTANGVTTRLAATRVAALLAASQRYHRRRIRWTMGPASLTTIHRGDVAWITHSLLDGGQTGRLRRIDGARLTLDAPVPLAVASNHVLLRLPTGALHASALLDPAAAGDTADVTLATPMPDPAEGGPPYDPRDVLWRYYATDAAPAQVRIVSVVPRAGGEIDVEAIDESAAYHAAGTVASVSRPAEGRQTPAILDVLLSAIPTPGDSATWTIDIVLVTSTVWHGALIEVDPGQPEPPVSWSLKPPARRWWTRVATAATTRTVKVTARPYLTPLPLDPTIIVSVSVLGSPVAATITI